MIRTARADDLSHLRDVEQAAGALFRELGMTAVAEGEPPSLDELACFQNDGRAWVVTDAADNPVAFMLVGVVDGNAHIEQVSVDPSHARQGLGRSLLDTASAWAEERGLAALTLTTYAEVPWNAPYYRRLGFQELTVDQMSSGLRHIRDQESARWLDEWPRVAMRRQLDPPSLSS